VEGRQQHRAGEVRHRTVMQHPPPNPQPHPRLTAGGSRQAPRAIPAARGGGASVIAAPASDDSRSWRATQAGGAGSWEDAENRQAKNRLRQRHDTWPAGMGATSPHLALRRLEPVLGPCWDPNRHQSHQLCEQFLTAVAICRSRGSTSRKARGGACLLPGPPSWEPHVPPQPQPQPLTAGPRAPAVAPKAPSRRGPPRASCLAPLAQPGPRRRTR
jgi:hypothetical protein